MLLALHCSSIPIPTVTLFAMRTATTFCFLSVDGKRRQGVVDAIQSEERRRRHVSVGEDARLRVADESLSSREVEE